MKPVAGDISCKQWETIEGSVTVRHVLIVAAIRPHRYVVRPWKGHGSKDPAVKSYGVWMTSTREQLQVALMASGIEPFPADWRLGVAISSAAAPMATVGAATTKSGDVDKRTVSDVLSWDLRNLDKAIEDCMKGILWGDDKQVRTSGPGAHFDTGADAFAIHCWGTPDSFVPWQHAWDADSVPYEFTWLRTGDTR